MWWSWGPNLTHFLVLFSVLFFGSLVLVTGIICSVEHKEAQAEKGYEMIS